MDNEVKQKNNNKSKESVHFLLAHAYLIFFFSIILGVFIDSVIPFNFLENINYSYFGLIFIFGGTIIVYWAQKSSSKAGKIKIEESSMQGFRFGPYKFIKHPTYLGLFFLALGFSILIESIPSFVLIFITHIFIRFTFIKKEEKILEKKYGDKYLNYKSKK